MNQMKIFATIGAKYGTNYRFSQHLSHMITRHMASTVSADMDPTDTTDSSARDPMRDRTRVVSPQQSIQYVKSTAFAETYAHYKVWQLYRRNFKGQFSPFRSRDNCIIDNYIYTSNPCPVCRDEYLVLHYTNMDLLNQFIN
ncbi:unnamed protein product, partial [Medioppia subpectinata]